MGSGDPPGLQNRREAGYPVSGAFDSHTLPPFVLSVWSQSEHPVLTASRGTMAENRFIRAASLVFAFCVIAGLWQVRAQDAATKTPYPSMASLEQYLTPRDAEIALARSAAPESISRDATVLFLGRHGYETAVEGKNGFVCVVER